MDTSVRLRFSVLGPVRAFLGDAPCDVSGRPLSILALLLARANQVVSTDEIIDVIWPENDPQKAASNLGYHIHKLRRAIGDLDREVLTTHPPGYRLMVGRASLDSIDFEQRLGEAESSSTSDSRRRAEQYRAALNLWGDHEHRYLGTAYAEFRYEQFTQGEIRRLDELRSQALEDLTEAELQLGRHREVLPLLAAAVEASPERQRLWEHRLIALYRDGRQSEALREYARVKHLLGELGLEPAPELKALDEQILLEDPRLLVPEQSASRPTVPETASRMFGREVEISSASRWILERPMVSITGLGGVGKTTVALEVARRVQPRFPGGVAFIDVAALQDPTSLELMVAAAFGLRQQPGRRSSDAVVEHLSTEPALVVLDNCESALTAVLQFVENLTSKVRQARILATSRIPLGIDGEQRMLLGPLGDLDEPGTSHTTSAAVEMLFDRATLNRSTIERSPQDERTAAEICRALGGLPLAIEIAGKALSSTSMSQLARELTESLTTGAYARASRRRVGGDISAILDWTYDQLDEGAKAAYRALGVTISGVHQHALANWVPVPAGAHADPLEHMDRLAIFGLVAADIDSDTTRFRVLEPVRQHAHSLLEEAGEVKTAEDGHISGHARLATRYGGMMLQDPSISAEVSKDEANFVAAIQRARDKGDVRACAMVATALDYYWVFVGKAREGQRLLEQAATDELLRTQPSADLPAIDTALLAAAVQRSRGFLASINRDYEGAESLLKDAENRFDEIARTIAATKTAGEDYLGFEKRRRRAANGAAWSRFHHARSLTANHFSRFGFATSTGDHRLVERADALYERAEETFAAEGESVYLAYLLPFAGWNAVQSGSGKTEDYFIRGIRLARENNLTVPLGIAQVNLAWYHIAQGRVGAPAIEHLVDAVADLRKAGDVYSLQIALTALVIAGLQSNREEFVRKPLAEAMKLMAAQGRHEWEVVTMGVAAAALAGSKSRSSAALTSWLGRVSPDWRELLQAMGVPTAHIETADTSTGVHSATLTTADIARLILADISA